eukprot:2574433-Rhodomonas_salina.2
MSGTVLAHGPTRCLGSRSILGTGCTSGGRLNVRSGRSARSAIRLRACYAMSGTNTAHGAIGLRACYAMPGTDTAHGAVRCPALAVCAYARAVQCPALTKPCIHRRAPYAMFGTEVAYAATRWMRRTSHRT